MKQHKPCEIQLKFLKKSLSIYKKVWGGPPFSHETQKFGLGYGFFVFKFGIEEITPPPLEDSVLLQTHHPGSQTHHPSSTKDGIYWKYFVLHYSEEINTDDFT